MPTPRKKTKLNFKDFEPADKNPGMLKISQYETITELIERASNWINTNNVNFINIETIIIPAKMIGGITRGSIDGETSTKFFQVIRVWYQEQI